MTSIRRKQIRNFLSQKPLDEDLIEVFISVAVITIVSMLNWSGLDKHFADLSASHDQIFVQHEYYRLFTALCLHADWGHLLGNMLFFVPFAWLVRSYFGRFMFPVVTVLAGALTNYFTLYYYPPDVSLMGASGVVYFLVAFWLVLYLAISKDVLSFKQKILRGLGLVLAELSPQKFDPQISYSSHAIGFSLGILIGLTYYFANRSRFKKSEVWIELPPEEDLFALPDGNTNEILNKF